MTVEKFVARLASTRPLKHSRNPWDFSRKGNEIRRKNLIGYLTRAKNNTSHTLLVGEAPGYRGAARSGVPFCSEKLILAHPFFADRTIFDIENKTEPIAESSASIVWQTFDRLNFYPLMWATYPFHPHEPNNVLSNRAPRSDEIDLGKEFLSQILDLFKIEKIVAVGRVAERTLGEMGYGLASAIRHPSHGGAIEFAKGLERFLRN